MGIHNEHEYIEIGGMKWASMNVGANSITDYGKYFQWGDTAGYYSGSVGSNTEALKKPFSWADYSLGNGKDSPGASGMTKYNSSDTKTVLDLSDDAAHANWGGSWRMPTTAEFQALGNAVNTAWTASYQGSGVAGMVCTAKDGSGAELFFPAAGRCNDGSVSHVGDLGIYWSSSLRSSNVQRAYVLNFNSNGALWGYNNDRFFGFSVRPVVG